jgi:hypothetical protein
MKPKLLLRIAACLLLFFACGHSIGHFTRHDVTDPKAREVLRQMTENKFDMFGQQRSYDQNYTGMSLNLILTLFVFASILLMLSTQTEKEPLFVKNLLVPITFCVVGFSVTGFLYFFTMPAVTCLFASLLTIWAIIGLSNKKPGIKA